MKKVEEKLKPYAYKNTKPTTEENISLLKEVKKYLAKHPKKMHELVLWFINTKRTRDLLWKMIDGSPRTQSDINVRTTSVQIDADVARKYNLVSKPNKALDKPKNFIEGKVIKSAEDEVAS